MAHIKYGYKDDLVSRKELHEIMMRHRPLYGSDGSKERYAYIEWLGIYHAIKEMESESSPKPMQTDCSWK